MQDRKIRENSDQSGNNQFDNFGARGLMFPSIFGGKDPFDDPFFSRPLFGSSMFSTENPVNLQNPSSRSKGPLIQEMDSDDEKNSDQKEQNDADLMNKNPIVEHPEDQGFDHGKNNSKNRTLARWTNHSKVEGAQPRTRSESFKRVTYGGVNGTYYSATISRRTGDDGVTLEESKQADKTTGQATHRISRGIHDKGHSVTRKLDSDGKVDTMQTLHNLNEDELAGFEQTWQGNVGRNLHGRFDFPGNAGVSGSGHGRLADWGGFVDPFRIRGDHNFQPQPSRGRPKKTVTINIE